jgi:hypothetical protein
VTVLEHRRIVFGLGDLREAAAAHLPEISPGLVPREAEILGLAIVPETLSLRLRLGGDGAPPSDAEVSTAQLGALLIRRCRALGIPLPRCGAKALEADMAGVTMVIQAVHDQTVKRQRAPSELARTPRA